MGAEDPCTPEQGAEGPCTPEQGAEGPCTPETGAEGPCTPETGAEDPCSPESGAEAMAVWAHLELMAQSFENWTKTTRWRTLGSHIEELGYSG